MIFRILTAFRKMFIRCVILNIDKCDMQYIQTDFDRYIYQVLKCLDLFECVMLAVLLKSPALTETGEMQCVAVHSEFKFSVLIL